jgi:hypothetical protein
MSEPHYDELGYKKRRGVRKSPRPNLVSFLCVLLFAYGLWAIAYSFTGNIVTRTGLDTVYPAINALMIVFSFVALSGVWAMEKWGPVSFGIVLVLKLLIDLIFGHFNWLILLGFIPAAIFLLVLPKMRESE